MVVSRSPLKDAHISKIGPQIIPKDTKVHIISRMDFPTEEARNNNMNKIWEVLVLPLHHIRPKLLRPLDFPR